MKSKPREFVAQDTEIPITGHCNTFPKVDIFCAAIILDILGDSLYSQWLKKSCMKSPAVIGLWATAALSSPILVFPLSQRAGGAVSHHRQQNTTVSLLSPEITRFLETERMCSLPPSLSPVTCLEEADHSLAAVNAALCSQHGCNLYFFFPLAGRRAEPRFCAGSVLVPCFSLGFPSLK